MSIQVPEGMRRTKAGAYVWKKQSHVRPETPIPNRTLENQAACRAVGLSFWSDAPKPSSVWAVDDNQKAHLVKLNRNQALAHHEDYCSPGCTLPERKESWK
ncbi:hypothetical protein FZI85_17360 [Mycobacterium sp. CBMA293]|uniref:DUF7457 domain-containing protein n=1 Tax=unclassified Mycolicibacterium TaxID=2636767 RepID=UPI0012DF50AB|nr:MULTISPECIES: hypothetical protein [unclassified Mycolicibacterium]MUL44491.1 hypothetical protein [Mycolicibacterium sp. CBMA 360]MUL59811.1 hypothetical protein [Mycolicibacterium sp. CBMA 335]MUL68654.1 hypothetical protein [Mycolicibacterium sp. CBMA 311]MUL93955.1 hypothetical protein [Mycolicibacterium sp. CBMA 230]MUM06201.1 hypothetical protein [Mycolicibacterium sp. CBMA 213]